MRKRNVMRDAASWFVEIIITPDLDQLWPRFERWLKISDEHRCAYECIEQAWCVGYRSRKRTLCRVQLPRVTNIPH